MRTTVLSVLLAGLCVALCVGPAETAPKPSLIPASWQLNIELTEPLAIEVDAPRGGGRKAYWYVRFTTTNHTGQDQLVIPEFMLYTSTGQLLRSDKDVPAAIFRKIKNRHNEPLLNKMTGMTGKMLQGDDNAKMGVAIWPDFDHTAMSFDIFIGGISGETVEIELPKPIQVTRIEGHGKDARKIVETKKTLILSKTLHLEYAVSTDPAARTRIAPRLVKKEWLMR